MEHIYVCVCTALLALNSYNAPLNNMTSHLHYHLTSVTRANWTLQSPGRWSSGTYHLTAGFQHLEPLQKTRDLFTTTTANLQPSPTPLHSDLWRSHTNSFDFLRESKKVKRVNFIGRKGDGRWGIWRVTLHENKLNERLRFSFE